MNRAQRRATAKAYKVDFKLLSPDTPEVIDHTGDKYCWRHSKAKDPTQEKLKPADKKYLESIRMLPTKSTDKEGNTIFGRRCGRCSNSIILDKKPTENVPGYTTK